MQIKSLIALLAALAPAVLAQSAGTTPVSQCLALCVAGALKSVNSSPCTNTQLAAGFDSCLEGEKCPEAAQVSQIRV